MIAAYRRIGTNILLVIAAEFFIQLVNAMFLNLQSLYMKAEGYNDAVIADYISWRYAGVLLLALPMGRYIKGKSLLPLFKIASIGVPVFGLLIIMGIHLKWHFLLILVQFLWGASFTFMQIPVLPYILRHAKDEDKTPAISLSYSTWSFAGIAGALLVWILNSYDADIFSERNLLLGTCVVALLGWFILRKVQPDVPEMPLQNSVVKYSKRDYGLMFTALFPALIIATGAGLTIPFINLFFARVHELPTNTISLWNFVAAILVAWSALQVPRIKKYIGYLIAVPATQSLAVISLIALATTEWYRDEPAAVTIAIFCYLLRQPLMNVAGPMTSEIAMDYVGEKNREITSALIAAVWSGSWFISTRFIFGELRDTGWPYVHIFLITAALYAVGVVLYGVLVVKYNAKRK
mgnify:CR=1 FL=1